MSAASNPNPKPVIVAVDDDPSVLSAVMRDLRRRYAEQYRIVRAESGRAALEALEQLKMRSETVALLLADQRMPEMSGVEFLSQALHFFPEAKRALLTAYADTNAAIQAINSAAVHYYLLKPWDPPEEQLYPVLDDLLEDWQANYRPAFVGIRVIGHRWSREAHHIKDFLARNHVPYLYLDVNSDAEACILLERLGMTTDALPVVVYPDGQAALQPSTSDIAHTIGLKTQAQQPFYDLCIVGGGPAGLAAAVYGASEGLRTVLIEREATGGQAGTSSRIENYLGFPTGLSGGDLARRATAQAKRFGVEILTPQEAVSLRLDGPYKIVQLSNGTEIACHALVVAVGLSYSKLAIPGADHLTGAGVYYGASLTEAISCSGQRVVIVGAGNSAGQAAIYLANYAQEVVILVRGQSLEAKMSKYLVDRIEVTENIRVILETTVTDASGDDHLERVTYKHLPSDQETTVDAAGLFIFIGAVPATAWLRDAVRLDAHGFVLTGSALVNDGKPVTGWPLERLPYLLEGSVPGVFVVGDVRAHSVKRVASAVGEGSIAVQFVHQYLSEGR